jgi:hypothetical protein
MEVKEFAALLPQATEQLPRGAFLTAEAKLGTP